MKGWNEAKDQAVEVMARAIRDITLGSYGSEYYVTDDEARELAEDALTALLEATQSETCATCGGLGYIPPNDGLTLCPDCTDGRVPGAPLVLLAPRQVGWHCTVEDLGWLPNERPATWLGELCGHYRNDISREPLYAAQTEEKQT